MFYKCVQYYTSTSHDQDGALLC